MKNIDISYLTMVIDRYLHWVGTIIVGDIVPFKPSHVLNCFPSGIKFVKKIKQEL